jgi:nucleotide-binding universal stress UspA family protein
VVGTDFSDGAQDALERALHLAEDSGARVALVHAYEETAGENVEDDPTATLLVRLAQEVALRVRGGAGSTSSLSCGRAARGRRS